jgi:hypothetical protein
MVHYLAAPAAGGSTGTGAATFLSSSLGQWLQTALRVLAFPVGLYFIFTIIKHGMKQRHRDIVLSVIFGGLILAVMADLTVISGLITFFATLGKDLVNFFSGL